MNLWRDRMTGFALAGAVFAQAALLAARAPNQPYVTWQILLGGSCLAALTFALWRRRGYFNPHSDMLIVMFSFGGLGMLLGMLAGGGASRYAGSAAWWLMCSWMLVFGLVPAIPLSRCLATARRERYLLAALLIDGAGMLGGMAVATLAPMARAGGWMLTGHHVSMLSGMLLGMGGGMSVRALLFGKKLARGTQS